VFGQHVAWCGLVTVGADEDVIKDVHQNPKRVQICIGPEIGYTGIRGAWEITYGSKEPPAGDMQRNSPMGCGKCISGDGGGEDALTAGWSSSMKDGS
jgi:hypothetical protein